MGLTLLINELAVFPKEIVLVYDDFHVLENPVIVERLDFFLKHSPPNFHLIIASRSEPTELDMAFLRAKGRVFDDPTLARVAGRHGKNPGQVTLRWLVQQGVAAIPRSSSEVHAKANLEIFDFALSDAEMAEIAALAHPGGRRVNVPGFAPRWD